MDKIFEVNYLTEVREAMIQDPSSNKYQQDQQKYLTQARVALEIYVQRGEQIIGLLQRSLLDKGLQEALWLRAAYHNFRAAERQISQDLEDPLKEPRFAALLKKAGIVNRRLVALLNEIQVSLAVKVSKVNKEREKIDRFHSGLPKKETFRKTI